MTEVGDLSVRYGATPALTGVDPPLHRGCITALVDPSGCGKSTFLTCLNRLADHIPGCQVRGRRG